MRRVASQTRGLIQNRARTIRAMVWVRQSHRFTWASSCNRTTRRRCSDQCVASAGSRTTGRHQPQVSGMGLSADCHRLMDRRRRSLSPASRKSSAQSVVSSGNPCRASLIRRTWASSMEIKPSEAPQNQITKATTSQVLLSRAAKGWVFPEPWLAAAATVPAVEAGVMEDPAPAPDARLSVSEIWLPELKSVETDQSGLCQDCGRQASNSKQGRLATARNQIQWRVAAAARGKSQHKPAGTVSTATLLSQASKSVAVPAACCRQPDMVWNNAFMLAAFLSGLFDGLLQVV